MYSEELKTEQPLVTKFFEAALTSQKRKLAHAFMFTGNDIMAQYNFAIQTAKMLNCTSMLGYSENCSCTNCNWISQNRHPAIITISPIDYLYGNEDGKPKTVITIGQAQYLKQELSKASQYHRVIIFTDAEESKDNESKANYIWQNYREKLAAPSLDSSEEERTGWIPLPLTWKILHSESANALLKSIEEPPQNVTFFFLTKDREDMLETIVSRTQVLPVRTINTENIDFSLLDKFFEVFPPKNYYQAITYAERLIEIAKESSYQEIDLLVIIQEYMQRFLRENADDSILSRRIIEKIKKIEQSQNEIKNYVNKSAVFESLMIDLIE